VPAFFNHAGASPPVDAVVERVVAHVRREQAIGGYEAAAEVAGELAAVRASVARLVGGAADEVALTSGATDAFERLMWAVLSARVGERTGVVVDPFTYSSMWLTLGRWGRIAPIDVRVAAPGPDGTVDVASLGATVDHSTDVVVLTHMPTHQGTVTDAEGAIVAARAASPGAVIVLDVAQTIGQLPVDVAALGCDAAFAPGRKFVRAPRGTGFLWVRRDLAARLDPLSLPFGSRVGADGVDGLPPDATRFETFERPIAALLGLGTAVDHALSIGLDTIASRVLERSDAVRSILAGHAAVRPLGTSADRGIVTFTHEALGSDAAARALAADGVANRFIAGEPPMADGRGGFESLVRLSPHECTTDAELDELDAALGRLGA